MKLRKLEAIKAYILSLGVIAEENLQTFYTHDEYEPSGMIVSDDGEICLHDQSYTAVIRIERFPIDNGIGVFLINVACWIINNDPHQYRHRFKRNDGKLVPLPNIDPNIIEESSDTVAIELLIPFREPVFGIPDSNGPHSIKGIRYRKATDAEAVELEPTYIVSADYESVEWRRGS